MQLKTKLKYTTVLVAAALSMATTSVVHAATVSITNAGFESKFSGWEDTDPSAISSDERSGSKAAKITGSGGKFEQDVTVEAHTDYELTAYIEGYGKIGATVDGTRYTRTGGGDNYEKVTVSFNSGSETTDTIFGNYYEKEGRFDDFSLKSTGTTNSDDADNDDTNDNTNNDDSDSSATCTGNSSLTIVSATDDGTNDGHGPENAIDGNTDDIESRWSSKGIGKTITLDLGTESNVKELAIQWYKGSSRSSYFDIETSLDKNNWTPVLSGGMSSGADSGYEDVDVTDSEARYVRVIGEGNSANSTWNSIIEAKVLGCSDGTVDNDDNDDNNNDDNNNDDSNNDDNNNDDNNNDTDLGACESSGQMQLDNKCVDWLDVYEAEHGKLSENAHLLSYSPIEMKFSALEAQHETSNGNGWRHELKIKSSGDYRVAMTEVYELFKANIKADLSKGSKTIVAQHHAANTDTITKLYIADLDESGFENAPDGTESDSVAKNGIFDVYIRLAKEDGSGETKHLLTTIRSGESFDFEEENDHGKITVKINGQKLDSISVDDSSESYFKFGNYHQAQNPDTGDKISDKDDWPSFYDEYFSTSDITFTNMSYIRKVD